MIFPPSWHLSRAPFESAADAAFFYPSADHSEALARLEYLAREGGTQLGLLTGEIGCGKSLTRGVFAARSANQRRVAEITSSHYPFADLLRDALLQLGAGEVPAGASEHDLVVRLRRLLAAREAPVVLLFDEAQELDHAALVGLRALANLDDGRPELKLVLVGQPELRQKVLALPQLDQRAGLRFHLRALPTAETGHYLAYRLRAAGHPDGRLFAEEAVGGLAAASHGVPREINRLARLAMALAARRGASDVGAADVDAVVADLERQRGVSG